MGKKSGSTGWPEAFVVVTFLILMVDTCANDSAFFLAIAERIAP